MGNDSQQEPSDIEKNLIRVIQDQNVSKDDVLRSVRQLAGTERFVMKDSWIGLAKDELLENWRRLEAYKLLINHCLIYPCPFDEFIAEAITPMGINRQDLIDMSVASFVPLERRFDAAIFAASLPIKLATGQAAVYMSIQDSTNMVERAVVHPDTIEP